MLRQRRARLRRASGNLQDPLAEAPEAAGGDDPRGQLSHLPRQSGKERAVEEQQVGGEVMSIVDAHMYLGAGGPWYPGELSRASAPASRYDEGTPLDSADLKGDRFEPSHVLDACTQAGIDRACVQPRRHNEYSAANRFIADTCEKHANKLIGIAAHSPQRERGRIRQMLITEVRSMGLKAVRSDGHPSRELLDAARELAIPVIYYPMNGPVAQMRADYTQEWFYLMADVYSDVNFI